MALGSYTFVVAVPAAGTRVPLSLTPLYVRSFSVTALAANAAGNIFIGGPTVSAAAGVQLSSGQAQAWLPLGGLNRRSNMYDLSQFFIDASVNGNSVVVDYVV